MRMAQFLILHGTGATPADNWFMWLKGALVGKGHHVWLPQLPGAGAPDTDTYTKFLLSNKDFTFDENTILIGHSSGAVEILHLLQHLPEGTEIKAAILVSVFKDDLGWDNLSGLFTEPLDFDSIAAHCTSFTYIHADNDPYAPLEHAEYFAKQTGGKLITIEGQGHFNTEPGPKYKRFPELLQIAERLV